MKAKEIDKLAEAARAAFNHDSQLLRSLPEARWEHLPEQVRQDWRRAVRRVLGCAK